MEVYYIMKRNVYTSEFKRQAVDLVVKDDFTVKQVSGNLGIHENSLYRWIGDVEKYGANAFPGHGSRAFEEQSRIKQLEKENKQLQEELELLKKFQVFIKKNQQ